jgi:hypothetical protein
VFLALSNLVFVVSFLPQYIANPEFDPLENDFNFQLKILLPIRDAGKSLHTIYSYRTEYRHVYFEFLI